MGRKITMLSALISLLTGCAKKPAEPLPQAPGVSVPLSYPVLLAGERNLVVKDDEESLTTTTVASGLNFPQFKLIDSGGMEYSIRKVTEFGKRSVFADMGTRPFRVFLEMKGEGKIGLAKAKALVQGVALDPNGVVSVTPHGAEIATRTIQGAQSLTELIQVCRKTWEWR
jgi:hypothetical protein